MSAAFVEECPKGSSCHPMVGSTPNVSFRNLQSTAVQHLQAPDSRCREQIGYCLVHLTPTAGKAGPSALSAAHTASPRATETTQREKLTVDRESSGRSWPHSELLPRRAAPSRHYQSQAALVPQGPLQCLGSHWLAAATSAGIRTAAKRMSVSWPLSNMACIAAGVMQLQAVRVADVCLRH